MNNCTADHSLPDAIHEAGHAVAYMLAFRDLAWGYKPFHRVLIRRDVSKPYIDDRGRERDIRGIVEAPSHFGGGQWMWDIVVSMAGPAAEAMRPNGRLRYSMVVAALSGGHQDFDHAWGVIERYQHATGRRHGDGHFWRLTCKLVRCEWSAIEALAHALLKFEVIEYDQAAAIALPLLTVRPAEVAQPQTRAPGAGAAGVGARIRSGNEKQ